jgi:hypothetical protein
MLTEPLVTSGAILSGAGTGASYFPVSDWY